MYKNVTLVVCGVTWRGYSLLSWNINIWFYYNQIIIITMQAAETTSITFKEVIDSEKLSEADRSLLSGQYVYLGRLLIVKMVRTGWRRR